MRSSAAVFLCAVLASCAIGPTPERSGFDYPQAGLKFSPRRHVTSDTLRGAVAASPQSPYTLLFPRTTSSIENPYRRLYTTGIVGEWDDNRRPLFDEISVSLFRAELEYDFELVEERPIELPWPGLASGSGTLRVFRLKPHGGGADQYTFAVLVHHWGNTIEFCWRDQSEVPPDEEKMEQFFYWTHGMRFREPEAGDGG
jgi:hypothetical protein